MIVGRGLVASAFRPYFESVNGITVFASGVSNSRETRVEEFLREADLLRSALRNKGQLLYFGSCSVLDPEMADTPYVQHKLEMEALVENAGIHTIFRLPQVVGISSNPNLLTNFLHKKVRDGEHFTIWKNARRNLIDVADIAAIVAHLIRGGGVEGCVYNIACPYSVSVFDIVQAFESALGKNAVYSLVDAGSDYAIDVPEAIRAAADLGISFTDGYLEKTIRKYYG